MELITKQLQGLRRQNAGKRPEMLFNSGGIGRQPVQGDQCRQAGEQGEQNGVCDAPCDKEQICLRNLTPRPP